MSELSTNKHNRRGTSLLVVSGLVTAALAAERILPSYIGTPGHIRGVAGRYTDAISLLESSRPDEQKAVEILRTAVATTLIDRSKGATLEEIEAQVGRRARLPHWDPTLVSLNELALLGVVTSHRDYGGTEWWVPTEKFMDDIDQGVPIIPERLHQETVRLRTNIALKAA